MQGNEIRIDRCAVCHNKGYVGEFVIESLHHKIVRICLDCLKNRVYRIEQKKRAIKQPKKVIPQKVNSNEPSEST